MKVAVPVFEGRVSSVFDWAQQLLVRVVESDGASPATVAEVEVAMDGLTPEGRGRRLAELGVDALLCGGISAPVAALVEEQGIKVTAGLVGEVGAVLDAFARDMLGDPAFAMPGWRCCVPRRRRRVRRCRRRHGRHGRRGKDQG